MIVGIRGKIGAGKDAIAARLVDRWGFRVVRFADALRAELFERLPLTLRALHDQTCSGYHDPIETLRPRPCRAGYVDDCIREMLDVRKPRGARELLQEYGTEIRRRDDPDYWLRAWRARAVAAGPRVVVPDVRFPNEAEALLALGGQLWHVERPGTTVGAHASETVMDAWDRWDAVIRNAGTLDELHAYVDALASAALESAA